MLPWLAQAVDLLAARPPEPEQRYWLATFSHQVQLSTDCGSPRLLQARWAVRNADMGGISRWAGGPARAASVSEPTKGAQT